MKVEDEWDRDPDLEDPQDLLFVTYDTDKVTQDQLVETIHKQGFEAEIK